MKSGKGKQTLVVPIPAPADLSARAQIVWRELTPRRIQGTARLALLEEGLRSLDRAAEATAILKAAGAVVSSKRSGLPHEHPAVAIEHRARTQFLRTWKTLGLGEGGGWPYGC